MKALILAAGSGSRMMPHTASSPKCLMHFAGKRLFDWQSEALAANGVNEITVVGGYQIESWQSTNVSLVENSDWAETNMVHSLFCARDLLNHANRLVLSYGDIVFEPGVVRTLLDTPGDIVVATDKEWERFWSKRFSNPLEDAESLTLSEENLITDIGQNVSDITEIQAQFMGLMCFNRKGLDRIMKFYDDAAERADWMLGRTKRTCYTTDFLRGLIMSGESVRAALVHGGWLEFDTPSDLALYEAMHKDESLKQFFRTDGQLP